MTTVSKVAIGVGSITGVTAVTATSVVLAGGSGDSTTNPSIETQEPTQPQQTPVKKPFQKPTWQHKSIPTLTNAGDIQNKYQELPCIKEDLKEISNWPNTNTSSDLSNVKKFPSDANTKSCLVVEYYKQTYTDNKWWGEFRLAWSIKNEKEGQGFLSVIDVKTKDGKFLGSSAAYILQKQQESQDKWSVLHAKANAEHEINEITELNKFNPQTGYEFRVKKWNSEIRWGFEHYLSSTCEKTYCSETSGNADHKHFIWEFTGGTTGGWLHDWCENLGNWLNDNFGFGGALSHLSTVRGTWTKRDS